MEMESTHLPAGTWKLLKNRLNVCLRLEMPWNGGFQSTS